MALYQENKMQDHAIKVTSVHKSFKLPHEQARSVKSAFTKLFRHYGGAETQKALQGVSFDVKKGEFFGIVGRNGSGKSTLLKILAGIYQPTKGTVDVQGKLVPFIELGVGFNPELTGRENVFLNGALLGFSKKEVEAMYEDIVGFAELEKFMDQKLKNYSSGMQVRLAFSLAIRAQADILLIDEVLAVGDADFQRKCFRYFKSLKKQETTVIFVTHDMDALREYCDRVVLIDNSKLIAEGSAEDVAEKYLRLFMEDTDEGAPSVRVDEGRWGDESIVIEYVRPSNKLLTDSDAQLSIEMNFVAKEDVVAPVAGFSVRDAAGAALLGTNTRIKRTPLGDMKRGESRTVIWTLPNILADGKHTVTATIEHDDGITVCDWWNSAASFTVRKAEKTAYSITPQVTVRIKK